MLNPGASLLRHADESPELPRLDALAPLYSWGWRPRKGELMMIAGRSSSGKSTFALHWVAMLGIRALYFSADMSASQVGFKLASMRMRLPFDEVERRWWVGGDERRAILDAIADLPMQISYGPITYAGIDRELDAYVELWDAWPEVIVIDNVMDVEGSESDYSAQQYTMQYLHELKSHTGSTVVALHHATDKTDSPVDAPPSRRDIKNGLSEKPEQILTVNSNPFKGEFAVAVVKQRLGRQDPTARDHVKLRSVLDESRFEPIPVEPVRPIYGLREVD